MVNVDPNEIRKLIHPLRETLSAISLDHGVLEREPLSSSGQARAKSIRASIDRAIRVFEEIDFMLENGRTRTPQSTFR